MKKLLSLSPSKIYLVCGLGLLMTLGSFWHHQVNQTSLDRMNVLNQGVSTCFNRISQTFTAMMIKDIQSPYLNRGFMSLSDECLNETIKGINPFRQNVGKGYETLNQLISEVHWFHEKILKIHTPMIANTAPNAATATSLAPIADRYGKMEGFKVNLMDEIDSTVSQLRQVQMNDEVLMGAGLILFVMALSLLSLQEFNRIQLQREIEKDALNLLKAGQANVGAMVDRLVNRALTTQGMVVTSQIFNDYHGELLERMAGKGTHVSDEETQETVVEVEAAPVEEMVVPHKTSLKEVLVSIQKTQPENSIQMSDVRDVQLAVPYESFEQMMSAAINQMGTRRQDNKKVMISNQIHSDRSIITLFLGGSVFTASELEFASGTTSVAVDIDMNLLILKEMVSEAGVSWHLENKADRNGNITGMSIRLIANRVPKEARKNLVSVFKGKKKDLARELMN